MTTAVFAPLFQMEWGVMPSTKTDCSFPAMISLSPVTIRTSPSTTMKMWLSLWVWLFSGPPPFSEMYAIAPHWIFPISLNSFLARKPLWPSGVINVFSIGVAHLFAV